MKSKRADRGYPGYESWPHPKAPLPPEDVDEIEAEASNDGPTS